MTTHHDAVGDALEAWVNGLPDDDGAVSGSGDIGVLGDWMAVVSMVRVSSEGVPVTEYYLCMKDGSMLPHMCLGLIEVGKHLITDQTGGRDG
jgi:hypothetical protein